MRPFALVPLLAVAVFLLTAAGVRPPVPADAPPIGRSPAGAEDGAMDEGLWRQARGEFSQALVAFERAAAARGVRRAEALYGVGSCRLALGETEAARAAFREAARGGGEWRPLAEVGIGFAHERDGRHDRAAEFFARARGAGAGEAGPAALERLVERAERTGREDEARELRAVLKRRYPKSFEAARLDAASAR